MRRLTVFPRLRVIVFGLMLVTTSAAWLGRRVSTNLPAQLEDVPSHNGHYRASLLPSRDDWMLRVETMDGAIVSNARLAIESWMPEEPAVRGARPLAIAAGNGAYRIEGLGFARPGWWNVKLEVGDRGVTDSLAFNVIVP
jgi:hypothetical protein